MLHSLMHPTLARLLDDGPVLTDGAWATQLQQRGLGPGDFPDLWNLEHPERVLEVARDYVEAGSQVILTNTFGANRLRLADVGAEHRVEVLNRHGVRLSREAAGDRSLVFGSVGPSGKMLLDGGVTPEALREAFAAQAGALAEAGADGLVIETMSIFEEARIAVVAAKSTGLPVVACMVFGSGRDKDRTLMGASPESAARELTEAGADVIGANCGQGIAGFVGICRRLRTATDRPIWIKANAGVPEVVQGHAVYSTSPADFARHATALVEAGASFLGGCCGTTPQFVQVLGFELRSLKSRRGACLPAP